MIFYCMSNRPYKDDISVEHEWWLPSRAIGTEY